MRLTTALFMILAACAWVPAQAGTISYYATVDTSSQSGQYGYIDLQFNPSVLSTEAATATVFTFSTDGVLNPADPLNGTVGDVTGTLRASVVLANTFSTNEYTEGMQFGGTISFFLNFDGPALDAPDGRGGGTFVLDFLDITGNFLFTSDPSGSTAFSWTTGYINVNGDGSTSVITPPGPSNGPSVATFTAVPEPSAALLVLPALFALGVARRRLG
jgi:hypothetical protein